MDKTQPFKVLIVDDQRLFRQGLRSLLEQEEGLEVVGEAGDGQDAFTLVQETKPDIVLKDADHKEFIKIIRSTFYGESITSPFLANLSPGILHKMHDPARGDEEVEEDIKKFSLTGREKEILQLLLKGKSNKEISDLIYVSTETVKTHLHNIYRKLGVKSRLEVASLLFSREKE